MIVVPARDHAVWTTEVPVVLMLTSWIVSAPRIPRVATRPGISFVRQQLIFVEVVMEPVVMPMELPGAPLKRRKSVSASKMPIAALWPGMKGVPNWLRKSVWVVVVMESAETARIAEIVLRIVPVRGTRNARTGNVTPTAAMGFVKVCRGRIALIVPQTAEPVAVHVVSRTRPKGVITWMLRSVFVKTIRSVAKRMPGAALALNWQKHAVPAMGNVVWKGRLPVVPIQM